MSALQSNVDITLEQTERLLAAAARQIAPQWPLDQMIAVNPWWPKRATAFTAVCAEQQLLAGTSCLMPADWYLAQWQQQIMPNHLQQALLEAGLS
ncbi:Na-translocating system protein MpsB, partial [Alishewanella sp. SMS9]|nr:Na-translocating system protein MpsB [Alishewanella sp. SMS9]